MLEEIRIYHQLEFNTEGEAFSKIRCKTLQPMEYSNIAKHKEIKCTQILISVAS